MAKVVEVSVARRVTYVAAMAAILVAGKEAVAAIPNVEIVSLLIALFSVFFGRLSLYAIYIYVLAEGLLYGFNPYWFIPYLYIWTLLWVAARLLKKNEEPVIWAVAVGIFGLLFGTLCSVPYFITSGVETGVAYIVSGLSFDIIHCVANFILTLILWKPLSSAMRRLSAIS